VKWFAIVVVGMALFAGCSSSAEPGERSGEKGAASEEPLVVLQIPVEGAVDDPAVGFDAAWAHGVLPGQPAPETQMAGVPDPRTYAVYRFDEKSGAVTDTIPVGPGGTSLVVGHGAVWMGSTAGRVSRIDPATKQVTGEIPVDGEVWSLSAGEGAIWASGVTDPMRQRDGVVFRIDPKAGTAETVSAGEDHGVVDAVVAGEGWVWAVVNLAPLGGEEVARVVRIDPSTRQIAGETKVPGTVIGSPVPAKGGAWMLKRGPDGTVSMIRIEGDGTVVEAPAGSITPDRGLGGSILGGMWGITRSPEPGGLIAVRYDPSSGKALEQRKLEGDLSGELLEIEVGARDLWVGTYQSGGGLARVGPL